MGVPWGPEIGIVPASWVISRIDTRTLGCRPKLTTWYRPLMEIEAPGAWRTSTRFVILIGVPVTSAAGRSRPGGSGHVRDEMCPLTPPPAAQAAGFPAR